MSEPQSQPLLLRIGEVAQILKMSKLTVYRMIKGDDGLPIVRIGKRRSLRVPFNKFMRWAGLDEEDLQNVQPNGRNRSNGVVAAVQDKGKSR